MTETDTSPTRLRELAEAMETRAKHAEPRFADCFAAGAQVLTALAAEKDETIRLMADPNAVHINLLRGTIAKPTLDQIVHLYGREALLTALAAEKEAGAMAQASGQLIEVGETSRGYKLYRAPNPVGGNTYWSDEIGGGVVVWDTCLVGEETLRLALSVEAGAPAPDGWIPWEGGECPVRPMDDVDVRYRDGSIDPAYPASAYTWHHHGGEDDIIAYRIAKEEAP